MRMEMLTNQDPAYNSALPHTTGSNNMVCKVDQHSGLNGLNHDVSAIKQQIYILGVRK